MNETCVVNGVDVMPLLKDLKYTVVKAVGSNKEKQIEILYNVLLREILSDPVTKTINSARMLACLVVEYVEPQELKADDEEDSHNE